MPRRTDRAAQPVGESAVRFVIDCGAPAARQIAGVGRDKFGEDAGDRGGIVVGGDLGIACHFLF